MFLTVEDLQAIFVTLKLAIVTTIILLIIGTPLAWWLTKTSSKFKRPIGALVALPLVLPPTVIGYYLLIALSPNSLLGELGLSLSFSFEGLVIGSIIYSLPFVVQPLQSTFESIGMKPIEAAATLRASPIKTFVTIVLPLSKSGFVVATILSFAHTIGEFGVVLMIGGSIPNETKVVSIQIFDYVESMDYDRASILSLIMLIFSFFVLLVLYSNKRALSWKL